MPKGLGYAILILALMALIPPVLIARARAVRSGRPRVHIIRDMDNQPKRKAQQLNPLFADHRAMRRPVPGTVARGELRDDDHLYRGKVGGKWTTTYPVDITGVSIRRGQERFNIFCAPCHGLDGAGSGSVSVRALSLQEGTWIPPLSFHQEQVRERALGHVFNTITNGIRTMPAYGPQIPTEDRWLIVSYVRALQRSRNATLQDVPPEDRERIR
ncbi:MAG: cytochrome c [Phycisphaerales bacterium]|nr:MAG: cytochrome c [Phycisphaerales bacterium]